MSRKRQLQKIRISDLPLQANSLPISAKDGRKENLTAVPTKMTQQPKKSDVKSDSQFSRQDPTSGSKKGNKHTEAKRKPVKPSDSPNKTRKTDKATNKQVTAKKVNKKRKKAFYISEMEPTGLTQELVNIRDIRNGLIQTKNGKYIQILEIYPVNFYQRTLSEQKFIAENFGRIFLEAPRDGVFKSICVNTDYKEYIRHIMETCPDSRGEKLCAMRDDLIETIERIGGNKTISYRYFYIYSYEGDEEGRRSNDFRKIEETMKRQKEIIANTLSNFGNIVADPDNPTLFVSEIIYLLLNRRTSETESFLERKLRIDNDYRLFNHLNHTKRRVDVAAYFAPHGIYFVDNNWMMADGLYYTWLIIKDTGYPDYMPPDWISRIRCSASVDIDFFYSKLNHENTLNMLEKKNIWRGVSLKERRTNKSKENIMNKMAVTNMIISGLKQKQDLFDCCTVLTLRGHDPDKLMQLRTSVKKQLNVAGVKVEASYKNCEILYRMTMPFCDFDNEVYHRNKRNFLTSSMRTAYHFTGYESADPTGIVLGYNLENNSLFSVNNTNTAIYKNGNILIMGSSGAGKSFLEMAFGRRQTIAGRRVFYILPAKGFEYRDSCKDIGGTYISMMPGSNDVVNIMELFPKESVNKKFLQEIMEDVGGDFYSDSILAEKITSLCTWFKMLTIRENNPAFMLSTMDMSRMNSLLTELYQDFNITMDNDSIWEDKEAKIKKIPPIISDWQDRIRQDAKLSRFADLLSPFTTGIYKNMNGYTNVDLSNDYIVFDCDVKRIGKDVLPNIMYIAFDISNNIVKSDPDSYGMIFTDEIWNMLVDEVSAEQIDSGCRLIRGYGGCMIMASQDIAEFIGNKYGAAIIGNTNIKIVMYLEDKAFDALAPILKFKEEDRDFFRGFEQGEAMFISNREKTRFKLVASLNERISYNTDVTIKAKLEELKKQQLTSLQN